MRGVAKTDASSRGLSYQARAIRYQRPGFKPQTLLTSLLDPVAHPAKEIIALYHERREIELGYDEIKTEMLDRAPGAIPTRLRTKRELLPRLVLPDRRPTRQYPRAVKVK